MPGSLRKSLFIMLLLVTAFACGPAVVRAQDLPRARSPLLSDSAVAAPPAGTQGAANNGAGQTNFNLTPLTAGGEMRRAFKRAFLSPAGYAFTGLGAGITEARERRQPQKSTEDRVADGFSRFAIDAATRSANILLASGLYPVIFKQDPRYRPSGKKGFGPRAAYAASRVFVAYGDDGREMPNISRLGGSLTASALANIWERSTPGHDRIGVGPTFRRFGYSVGFGMLSNIIFKEFWPDIKRKSGKK